MSTNKRIKGQTPMSKPPAWFFPSTLALTGVIVLCIFLGTRQQHPGAQSTQTNGASTSPLHGNGVTVVLDLGDPLNKVAGVTVTNTGFTDLDFVVVELKTRYLDIWQYATRFIKWKVERVPSEHGGYEIMKDEKGSVVDQGPDGVGGINTGYSVSSIPVGSSAGWILPLEKETEEGDVEAVNVFTVSAKDMPTYTHKTFFHGGYIADDVYSGFPLDTKRADLSYDTLPRSQDAVLIPVEAQVSITQRPWGQ